MKSVPGSQFSSHNKEIDRHVSFTYTVTTDNEKLRPLKKLVSLSISIYPPKGVVMKLIKGCIGFFLLICITSCSQGKFWFQRNDPEPPYRLFDLLDDYPALYDAFSGIDQKTFNILLADSINADVAAVKDVLPVVANPAVVDPLVDTIGALRSIIGRIIYQDEYEWPNDSYESYATDLYSFLDDLSATSPGTTDEILNILRKVIGYIQYAHSQEIETVMADLIGFLQDRDGQNLNSVFPLLQEGLGKLLVRANTYYDENNNRLGNAVNGMDALISGINDIATQDPEAREALYDVMRETGKLLTAKVVNKSFADILKDLMINAEDYATVGGSVYSSNANYYNDNDTSTYYVNTELRNGIKQLWPGLVQLFIRYGDNPDACPIYDPVDEGSPLPDGRSALEYLTQKLYDLKLNCGIDFANYEIETSLKRMVEYNGFGKLRSSASYKVSYLDHLLFILIVSYDFGFLTRYGSATGEPYQNNEGGNDSDNVPHGHGLPTGGILTVNDCLYSMTSGAKHAYVSVLGITVLNEWLGAYELSLDPTRNKSEYYTKSARQDQMNFVFRSSTAFTKSGTNENGITPYRFPMGYNFPVLTLLSGFSVGDAGIPNGGKAGITPTKHDTTDGDFGTVNDFRTYYPYVGNGLGELNTGRWVMGWIARACWEGEGPYYYADPNAPTLSIGGKTYYVYFRPDGRIYALVYKEDVKDPNTWEYFYPVDGGNDVKDRLETQLGSYYLRENRYKAEWETDKIMLKSEYQDNGSSVKYYTINRVVGNTGTDKYLLSKLSPDKKSIMADAGVTNDLTAGGLTFREKIPEKSAIRECKSQEEALYRNFQWLMLEKKIVFIMPMRSYVHVSPLYEICGAVDLDPMAVAVLEANGIMGMNNLKKGSANGCWNIKGTEGTDVTGCTGKDMNGNTVNYGDSDHLGDGRIFVLVREDCAWLNILNVVEKGDYVDMETIWNTILGSGSVTPAILGDNLAPIVRMAFLQAGLVASNSSDIGNSSSETWQNRNKLLPIVVALAGDLHEKSYYQKPEDAYDPVTNPDGNAWYNFSGNHKYPLKSLRDLIAMLDSPMMKYYKTPYSGASKGWFVPQIKTPTFSGYTGNYGFFTPKPVSATVDFKPNDSLRSVISVISENTPGASDGLLPALANTKMVTKLMALLQKMGQYGDTALPIYVDNDKTSTDYTQWGARRKIFYGLEQILTRIKASKSIEFTMGYYNIGYPEWMFTINPEDVSLDTALDELIGSSDTDNTPETDEKGLAVFVDGREDSNPNRNWNNYYKLMNGIAELMSNQGETAGHYNITEDLISVVDKTLTSFSATNAQLKGLRHSLGAVLYYYDGSQWVVPNELKDILTTNLPQLLNEFSGHYANFLTVANNMLVDDGFIDYLMTNMSSSYPSQQVLEELYAFLGTDLIANPDSRLWDDVAELLVAFASMMNDIEQQRSYRAYTFEDYTKSIYTSSEEYLYSQQFDPYSGLGKVLTK